MKTAREISFDAQPFTIRENGQQIWKVNCWMAGRLIVCSPDFQDRGSALAYAEGINSGFRLPEYCVQRP